MLRYGLAAAAAALLLSACNKGPEDVTARYNLGGQAGAMTVKAAADGDARVEVMGSTLIRHDGAEYLVTKDAQGSFAGKVEDFAWLAGEAMRERGIKPPPMPKQPEFDLSKQGTETIAGITGDVWTLRPADQPKAEPLDAVISADRAYANVGSALAMQTRLATAGMAQTQGEVGNLEKRITEMLSKGMVLRFGRDVTLEKVEKTPFTDSDFALPKTVLDRAALKARIDATRKAMEAAAKAAGATPPVAPAAPQPSPTPEAKR